MQVETLKNWKVPPAATLVLGSWLRSWMRQQQPDHLLLSQDQTVTSFENILYYEV